MKLLFVLSKENIALAREEVLALAKTEKHTLIDNLLILEAGAKETAMFKRLGYAHEVAEFLFSCKKSALKENIEKFNFNKHYQKDYCVRCFGEHEYGEKELGSLVWHKLKNPKVNLAGPKTTFVFYHTQSKKGAVTNEVVVGKLLYRIDTGFMLRKSHLRPEPHPSSLHPRLARAMLNLTGKTKGVMLDPFCGSGGILIEAGLMGFTVLGYDLDYIMLNRAKINLAYYGVKKYNVSIHDATTSLGNKKVDAIVTDLPYGRNTMLKDALETYKAFLANAYSITDSAVVGFPDGFPIKKVLGKWKIKKKFTHYLHKSLSKAIVALDKR